MIVSVAATQMQCTWDESQNLEKAENLNEKGAKKRSKYSPTARIIFLLLTFVLNKKENIFL